MLKKLFLKKISSVLGLFIVCAFSLTLGAILLRVAYSAFTQPTKPPTDANQELGALTALVGKSSDTAGTATVFGRLGQTTDAAGADTLFGKIAGVGGGGGGLSLFKVKVVDVSTPTVVVNTSTGGRLLGLSMQHYAGGPCGSATSSFKVTIDGIEVCNYTTPSGGSFTAYLTDALWCQTGLVPASIDVDFGSLMVETWETGSCAVKELTVYYSD